MKTPEHLSQPENRIEKINLQDGETAYFEGKKYQAGLDPEYGYPYAKADTFIVGKNGPELEAWGGDCAVVSLYEANNKIGAVLHIDCVYIADREHADDLINKLIEAIHDIPSKNMEANVFVDIEDNENLPDKARQWHQMIVEKLRSHFSQIDSFTRGNGKDVRLNTETGELRVFDDKHRLIFSRGK